MKTETVITGLLLKPFSETAATKMEFGSKYVYLYADSDEETVSDDEFETGITDER